MAKKPNLYETMKALSAGSKVTDQQATDTKSTKLSVQKEETAPHPNPDESKLVSQPELFEAEAHTVSTREREHASTLSREHVKTPRKRREADVPKGFNVRPRRVEKPHQSVYAHPEVFKVLRRIAEEEGNGMRPQDLYREGLRYVLKKRGYDFDKLDRGEV